MASTGSPRSHKRKNPYPQPSLSGLITPPSTPKHTYNLRSQDAPSSPLYAETPSAEQPDSETPLVTPETPDQALEGRPAERSRLCVKLKSSCMEEKNCLKKENKLLQGFRKIAKIAMRAQKLKDKSHAHQAFVDQQRSRFTCTICDRLFVAPQTLDCGHTFCGGCLSKHRSEAESDRVVCPRQDCGQKIIFGPFSNNALGAAVKQFAEAQKLMFQEQDWSPGRHLQQRPRPWICTSFRFELSLREGVRSYL
ncbi:negative regulation of viral entry into host cell [Marasmius tenuissimus]|uniref:Negative regulation of viral entry into host cell n=1 Tax=Marasmius tenuissimus TaxID=585030 RepID=A0ABR2ZU41_9AGAR